MEKGECWTFKADVYPRYSFFQHRLQSLVPRWQKILEAGGLADCVSQGQEKLKEILTEFSTVKDKVTINIFADTKMLLPGKLKIPLNKSDPVDKTLIWWSSYIASSGKSEGLQGNVTVVVASYKNEKLTKDLDSLPDYQLRNVVIYLVEDHSCYLYTRLKESGFRPRNIDKTTDTKSKERTKSLPKQIQFLLEERVVRVLERISNYSRQFVPKMEAELDQTVVDSVHIKLIQSLQDPYVVKDLAPDQGGAEKQEDLDRIFQERLRDFVCKKTKCVLCENLSKKYGISSSLLNEFMKSGYFDYEKKVSDLLQERGLPQWPKDKRDGGLSTCKSFGFRCGIDLSKLIIETEDYVKGKIKVLTMMKKLDFEIGGYLLQCEVETDTDVPKDPVLPLDLQFALLDLPEILGCGTCYGELLLHTKQMLYPAMQTKVKEILALYKYIGGFKTELMKERKEQADGLLLEQGHELIATKQNPSGDSKYSFGSLGCFVHLKPKLQAHGADQCKAGAMVSTAYAIQAARDHCLTCAHVVNDCHESIKVWHGEKYREVGKCKYCLYQPDALDIALIEMSERLLPNCDSKLMTSERYPVENWRIFDTDPTRLTVQKVGCRTDFTKGIVMSTDYMTKKVKEYNAHYLQKEIMRNQQLNAPTDLDKCKQMNIIYNILVESLPGSEIVGNVMDGDSSGPIQVNPFSKSGDSGSVICADDPDNINVVNVVALLLGAVTRETGGSEEFLHSYGSLMHKTLDRFKEEYQCEVEPSKLPPMDRRAGPHS